jgi:hypothetical protein
VSAETLLHSLPKADSGGLLGLFKHPLERVLKLDEHYVNTTISVPTATKLRPKALLRRFAERLFGLIYALPNSL